MPIHVFYSPAHKAHQPPYEVENGERVPYRETPQRIETIQAQLRKNISATFDETHRQMSIESLSVIHQPDYLLFLASTIDQAPFMERYCYPEAFAIRPASSRIPADPTGRMGVFCSDLYSPIGPQTVQAALASANLAAAAAKHLLGSPESTSYALCRPPGHHAGPNFFGSYCYINNAALAAHQLKSLGKIAILDIDYHHGNGTQAIFWNDPRVFYTSIHIDPAVDYPFYAGYAEETGGSDAPDTNFNQPLPAGTTFSIYQAAMNRALQAINRFAPAALVISLGFDPYQGDPFSAFKITIDDYFQIGKAIAELKLPSVFIQEGGYAVNDLGQLAESFFSGWQ